MEILKTATERFTELSASIKEKEKRLAEIQVLKKHIFDYLVMEYYLKDPKLPTLSGLPVGTQNVNAISQDGMRYSIKSISSSTTGAFYGLEPPESKKANNKTQQNRQVGNAVPPLLGYALAKEMKSILGESE